MYCRFVPKSSITREKRGFSDQGRTKSEVQKVTASLSIPRSVNMRTDTSERATIR